MPALFLSCYLFCKYFLKTHWENSHGSYLRVQDLHGPVFHLCVISSVLQLHQSTLLSSVVLWFPQLGCGRDHIICCLEYFIVWSGDEKREETTLPLVTPRWGHSVCVLPSFRGMYWNGEQLFKTYQAFAQYSLLYINIGAKDATEEIRTSLGHGSHALKISEFGGKDISPFPIKSHDLEERGYRNWVIEEINGVGKPGLPPVLPFDGHAQDSKGPRRIYNLSRALKP